MFTQTMKAENTKNSHCPMIYAYQAMMNQLKIIKTNGKTSSQIPITTMYINENFISLS